jgi:hypothetical protein
MRMRSGVWVSLLLLMPFFVTAAQPEPTPSNPKEALIRDLLKTVGTTDLMEQMKRQIFDSFRKMAPSAGDDIWRELERRFDVNELTEKLVPIYDKYYSAEDLKGIVQFYRSPLGQRVLSTMPKVLSESMAIGQEWGRRKGEEIEKELRSRKLISPARSERRVPLFSSEAGAP